MTRALDLALLRLLSWRLALAKLTPAGDERSARYLKRLPPHHARELAHAIFNERDNSVNARFVRWGWRPRTRAVLLQALETET